MPEAVRGQARPPGGQLSPGPKHVLVHRPTIDAEHATQLVGVDPALLGLASGAVVEAHLRSNLIAEAIILLFVVVVTAWLVTAAT